MKTSHVRPMITQSTTASEPCASVMDFHEYARSQRKDATMRGQWVALSHRAMISDRLAMGAL